MTRKKRNETQIPEDLLSQDMRSAETLASELQRFDPKSEESLDVETGTDILIGTNKAVKDELREEDRAEATSTDQTPMLDISVKRETVQGILKHIMEAANAGDEAILRCFPELDRTAVTALLSSVVSTTDNVAESELQALLILEAQNH